MTDDLGPEDGNVAFGAPGRPGVPIIGLSFIAPDLVFSSSPLDGESGPRGLALADFNLDGKVDLAATHDGHGQEITNTVTVSLGDGAGNFSRKSRLRFGESLDSIAVGDFNRDGNPDSPSRP